MSDPVKIKPEELWGVWDNDGNRWATEECGIWISNVIQATNYAGFLNHENGTLQRFVALPIVDLSGWVRKEEAQ